MENLLICNLDKLKTTELGIQRIKRNCMLDENADVIAWCKNIICANDTVISKNGKNWYVYYQNFIITINSYSYTIITAHLNNN